MAMLRQLQMNGGSQGALCAPPEMRSVNQKTCQRPRPASHRAEG